MVAESEDAETDAFLALELVGAHWATWRARFNSEGVATCERADEVVLVLSSGGQR
jgi:hypothetical protein